MSQQVIKEYLSPAQIIEQYPEISKVWTPGDVGYLLRLKLVRGKKLRRSCIILATDVLKVYNLLIKN